MTICNFMLFLKPYPSRFNPDVKVSYLNYCNLISEHHFKSANENLKYVITICCTVTQVKTGVTGLLTGCGEKKKKIVGVLGGKLCGKKWRLCRNCAGLRNHLNKQIFDHRAPKKTRHGGISG